MTTELQQYLLAISDIDLADRTYVVSNTV